MSSKPVLYYLTLSPPSRAVLMAANMIGVDLELIPVNLLNGEHLTPEFRKMNPQHTIPTLNDNGTILYDSHAICSYLMDKYGKNDTLFPKELEKRYDVEAKLHFDTGYLFARLRFLYEPILYHGSVDCSSYKIEYIQKCWDIMEAFLDNGPYLCGKNLTIADICCIATISSVDEIAPIDNGKYPKLINWMKHLASIIPGYDELNKKGADELKAAFKRILSENKQKANVS